MNEKVFKEYCEDCGCPLDICCKPKVPVVSLQALKEWCMKEKQILSFLIDQKEKYKQAEGYNKALNRILSWAEKEAKKQAGEKK